MLNQNHYFIEPFSRASSAKRAPPCQKSIEDRTGTFFTGLRSKAELLCLLLSCHCASLHCRPFRPAPFGSAASSMPLPLPLAPTPAVAMKTNHDIQTPKRDATRLSDRLCPAPEKRCFQALEYPTRSRFHSRRRRTPSQSLERNIKKTMSTAPAFPYNPHR